MDQSPKDNWTPHDAALLYGTHRWGADYFGVNDRGEMTVNVPHPSGTQSASLYDIVQGIQQRGYHLPVLLRIENLLDAQLTRLNEGFRSAIHTAGYQGAYRGVFPIKVNQQAQVIEEIVRFGARYDHGLEAGSKAELLLALAHLPPGGLLILNGQKDRSAIDLGLRAEQLGLTCYFVVESLAELNLLLERCQALQIRPLIGLRVKVSSKVGGLWTETSGDRSSFGLSTTQVLMAVDTLKQAKLLDRLQLLHCHLGSQIPELADIENGVREAGRTYAELIREGAALSTIDLGGGLAVDYTGSHAANLHSRNYSLADYCTTIVQTLADTLDPLKIPHPQIITESGRFTVAHASMLLFNILDSLHFEPTRLPDTATLVPELHCLAEVIEGLDALDPATAYAEALACREELNHAYAEGRLTLRERSQADNLFLAIAQQLVQRLEGSNENEETLQRLKDSLTDIYYGNFSVFQSLPDTWAIDQIFPVMPLHRHLERPTREAILADLTCDCDGKLDRFVTGAGERTSLPVHPLRPGEEYLLGVFMMGAYQETLGDLHNLFGDTHVISVRINEGGTFDILREVSGDSVADVLSYVEYEPQHLLAIFRARAEEAVRTKRISVEERQALLNDYTAGLRGTTYLTY